LKQFDDAFHLLADTPEVGTKCDFAKLGYRKFPDISHVIFYRILDKTQGQGIGANKCRPSE
jgi:toxin ParE1/3/4